MTGTFESPIVTYRKALDLLARALERSIRAQLAAGAEGYGLCCITTVDTFGLVGILALSLAVGLLAAWTLLNLAIVVMTRTRRPAHVELQPNALPDELAPEPHHAFTM